MQPPTDWPPVVRDNYEPIRILGKGGFAAVILARTKASSSSASSSSPTTTTNNNNNTNNQNGTPEQARTSDYVAIKVAGNATMGVTKKEQLYAHREIDILRAISHPNIMKCLDYVEPSPHTAMVLVLSYSPGPTVHSLLKKGGALSTIFGRVVIAQLVDAITYLHSHAVVHRDIKPDNVIVTGAFTSQSDIWDNPEDYDDDLDHDGNVHHHLTKPLDWPALLNKWHVTLIDFGFARALTKDDVHQPSPEYHQENMDASYHQSTLVADGDATSMGNSQSSKKL
jgi:serine/threonine protein kinase